MYRFIVTVALLLLVLLAVPALAEPAWTIYEIPSGTTDDFDDDGTPEMVLFTTDLDEYQDGGFTISINGETFTEQYCSWLDPTLRCMKAGNGEYVYGTIFMVSEYGPSDDPYTYMYMYVNGHLSPVGEIAALAENFTVNQDGMITTTRRTDMLGTWRRPADYVLARGFDWDEDASMTFRYVESPRDLYPMAIILDLKRNLPVRASRGDEGTSQVIEGGQKVALTATDDRAWVYVTTLDGEKAGWMHVQAPDWLHLIEIDGAWIEEGEVFDHVPYAD